MTYDTEQRQLSRMNSDARSSGGVTRTSEGGWRLAGTRVSLDSVILGHKSGKSPEMIVAEFPPLSVEQVRGAIAFYQSRRAEIDRYLEEQELRWRKFQEECRDRQDPLLQRMRARAASGS
jgi:uncharacterized protein (DUF433 family)